MPSLEALQKLKIMVVHPQDTEGERITRCLRRIGCEVDTTWPPPAEPPAGADVIFVLLEGRTRSSEAWFGNRPSATIIAIVGPDTPDTLKLLADAGPHGVISKAAQPVEILTSLAVARNLFCYEGRLHTKLRKLEETLKSVRKVEQAKTILMQLKNLKEPEAYNYLRRHAMNRGQPIGKVASAVVDGNDVLN